MKFSSDSKIEPRKVPLQPLCLLIVNFLTNRSTNRFCINYATRLPYFIQAEVEPKPIVTRSHSFSRALLHVIAFISSLDCLRPLWLASDNFGFGFYDTQLKSALH